jgi:hypothetical protein
MELTYENAFYFMSHPHPLARIIALELSVPVRYTGIYPIVTELLEAVTAKVTEWKTSKGTTIDNLAITQQFLRLLVRLILADDYTADGKWIAVCCVFDNYIDRWSNMLNSIRYRSIPGVIESAQKKTTLNLRRNFQRMFSILRQTITDELELKKNVDVMDWDSLQSKLLLVTQCDINQKLKDEV